MPAILDLPLQIEICPTLEAVHLPELFLSCLGAGDTSLAADLRHAEPPRPYTLSSFYRRERTWMWRITVLVDELWDPLMGGLNKLSMLPIEDGVPVDLSQVRMQQVSYETLLAGAASHPCLRLRFLSPTSTHVGKLSYPLPDPIVLFQSWFTRWNAFAPVKLERALLDVAAVHLAVSYGTIRTCSWNLGVSRQIGFVGRVNLRVVQAHKLGDRILQHINALAAYASFCGTGQRTAQGMGQTRYYLHDGATS